VALASSVINSLNSDCCESFLHTFHLHLLRPFRSSVNNRPTLRYMHLEFATHRIGKYSVIRSVTWWTPAPPSFMPAPTWFSQPKTPPLHQAFGKTLLISDAANQWWPPLKSKWNGMGQATRVVVLYYTILYARNGSTFLAGVLRKSKKYEFGK